MTEGFEVVVTVHHDGEEVGRVTVRPEDTRTCPACRTVDCKMCGGLGRVPLQAVMDKILAGEYE